ncbi:MAG TPA: hypothetical protein DCG06_14815 [Deltaproteobacteria bacterium]|nr:hypothetical protein [Deltaproteobacteria bacterium]
MSDSFKKTTEATPTKMQKATGATMFYYGSGAVAVGIKNILFASFVLLYYNQVLGMDPFLASSALALALVLDAVSDPLIGAWSDRVKSRLGRRHPFMYASILPFSCSIYFILQPPVWVAPDDLFLYLLLMSMAVRLSMTFYEVPRQALGPELTKDYEQRTALVGVATAFAWLGGAGMVACIYAFFFPETGVYTGSKALLNPEGYESMALAAAVAVFISCVFSTVGLQGKIDHLYVPPETGRLRFGDFLREARETLANRSWVVIFLAGLVFALFIGLQSGTDQYYNIYFWQWVPAQLTPIPIVQGLAVIAAALLTSRLAVGRDKKRLAVGLFSTTVVLGPLPLALRLLSEATGTLFFPPNGTDLLWWILLAHVSLMGALSVGGFILIGSMVADIVEQSQEVTGRRSEGLLSAGPALVQKTMSAGGVWITGILLSVFGFDAVEPTVESMREPMHRLAVFHLILGVSLPAISTYLVSKYTITRESHLERLETLGYADPPPETSDD